MTYFESQLIDNGTGTYLAGILSILVLVLLKRLSAAKALATLWAVEIVCWRAQVLLQCLAATKVAFARDAAMSHH